MIAADFVGVGDGASSFELPGGKALILSGDWKREADRITTQDPSASIEFGMPGRRAAVVAQCLVERGEVEMVVELTREYPRDGALDDDLVLDLQVLTNPLADEAQKRRAIVKVGAPRSYYLFRALPPSHQPVTLRFPGADKSPIAIYGLRLGD
jgi:hypothetical protein